MDIVGQNTSNTGAGNAGTGEPTSGVATPPSPPLESIGNPEKGATDWKAGLSAEHASNPSFKDYSDINGLAKSHLELEKMLGTSVRIPEEGASQEEVSKFYRKLGRPEEAGKYEYDSSEVPDDIKNDEALNNFKEKAFELGLSAKQFSDLAKYYDDMNINTFNENKTSQDTADVEFDAKMVEEFGDRNKEVFDNAQALFSKYLPEEYAQSLLTLDSKQLIGVVKTLDCIKSEFINEDSFTKNVNPASQGSKKDELIKVKAELKEMDEFSQGYKEKCQRKRDLYNEVGSSVYS